MRQKLVRWEHFEATKQNMPDSANEDAVFVSDGNEGGKCLERLAFEAAEAAKAEVAAAAAAVKAERAKKFKEARAKKKAFKAAAEAEIQADDNDAAAGALHGAPGKFASLANMIVKAKGNYHKVHNSLRDKGHHTHSTAQFTESKLKRNLHLENGATERADGALVLKDGSTYLKSGHVIMTDGTIHDPEHDA